MNNYIAFSIIWFVSVLFALIISKPLLKKIDEYVNKKKRVNELWRWVNERHESDDVDNIKPKTNYNKKNINGRKKKNDDSVTDM